MICPTGRLSIFIWDHFELFVDFDQKQPKYTEICQFFIKFQNLTLSFSKCQSGNRHPDWWKGKNPTVRTYKNKFHTGFEVTTRRTMHELIHRMPKYGTNTPILTSLHVMSPVFSVGFKIVSLSIPYKWILLHVRIFIDLNWKWTLKPLAKTLGGTAALTPEEIHKQSYKGNVSVFLSKLNEPARILKEWTDKKPMSNRRYKRINWFR